MWLGEVMNENALDTVRRMEKTNDGDSQQFANRDRQNRLMNQNKQNFCWVLKLHVNIFSFSLSSHSHSQAVKLLRRFWFLIAVLVVVLIAHYERRRRELKNTPPGPWGNSIPFVGYLPFLDAKRPEQSLSHLRTKYGKIFSLQMGSIYTVVLSDVALIREAFKQDELSGRAPLLVTHGIFYGHGEAKLKSWTSQLNVMLLL